MTKTNNGGTAFPMQDAQAIHAYAGAEVADISDPDERERLYVKARSKAISGMSLRDYFAAQALTNIYTQCEENPDKAAEWAYQIADAMLKARES